ncbi:DUF374 domain-containing protein [bacterium]|nr:DUF374 domain-containing protein [bacterium]
MNGERLFWIAEHLGPRAVALIGRTIRFRRYGVKHLRQMEQQDGFIYACPHGRMFLPVWFHRHTNLTTLVSQSRDGELVTRLVRGLGHDTVRGSSHRGASAGLKGLLRVLKRGGVVALMVDGPKGPAYEPKIGTIAVARMSGAPILPIVGAARHAWTFNSWDRFQLPQPFTVGVVAYGEPLRVPREADEEEMERYRRILQAHLVSLRDTADRLARGKNPR